LLYRKLDSYYHLSNALSSLWNWWMFLAYRSFSKLRPSFVLIHLGRKNSNYFLTLLSIIQVARLLMLESGTGSHPFEDFLFLSSRLRIFFLGELVRASHGKVITVGSFFSVPREFPESCFIRSSLRLKLLFFFFFSSEYLLECVFVQILYWRPFHQICLIFLKKSSIANIGWHITPIANALCLSFKLLMGFKPSLSFQLWTSK